MGAADQQGARVGHRRAAGFGHQPGVLAGQDRGEQGVQVGRGRAFSGSSRMSSSRSGAGCVEALEFGPGGLGVLDDEVIEAARQRGHVGEGRGRLPACRAQAGWDRGTAVPAAVRAARRLRGAACGPGAISGRPTRALGPSPVRASSRVMPRPFGLGAAGAVEAALSFAGSARSLSSARVRKRTWVGTASSCASPAAGVEQRPARCGRSRSWPLMALELRDGALDGAGLAEAGVAQCATWSLPMIRAS